MKKFVFNTLIFLGINWFFQDIAMQKLLEASGYDYVIKAFGFYEGTLYIPFTYLYIFLKYKKDIPTLLKAGNDWMLAGLVISLLTILAIRRLSQTKELTSSGTAKWAKQEDIEGKKLLVSPSKLNGGVICGTWYSGVNYESIFNFSQSLIVFIKRIQHLITHMSFSGFDKEKVSRSIPSSLLQSVISFISNITLSNRKYIVDPQSNPTHSILIAPSRAGKGIGIIIPTLLTWQGSCIVSDLKEENLQMSGAYRKYIMGHKVISFAPTDTRPTYRFNPVNEIRWGTPNEGKDVENLLDIIVGPPDGKDAHWKTNAKALLVGCLTHLKYKHARYNMSNHLEPEHPGYVETTLYHVREFLTVSLDEHTNEPITFNQKLEQEIGLGKQHFPVNMFVHNKTSDLPMLLLDITEKDARKITTFTPEALKTPTMHPIVMQQFGAFLSKPEGEGGSVLSTAVTALDIFGEKIIVDNTSTSDFILGDIRGRKAPTDLFLVVPPSDMGRVGKLFKLIMEFIVTRGTENEAKAKKLHKCLLLIDEFPAFGKMENFVRQLGYIASYGFKALIVVQGLDQIKTTYNNMEILTNAVTQIFLSPRDKETPEYLSNVLGKQTILLKQKSGKNSILPWDQDSVTWIEKERPLLMASETITQLANESVVIIESLTIRSPKNKWFICPDMIEKIEKGKKLNIAGNIGYRDGF